MILQAGIEQTAQNIGEQTANAALTFAGNPGLAIGGIALLIIGIIVLFFLKKIVINSILGAIAWAVIVYGLGVNLPLIPSLIVGIIFGLPGIGAMLLLRFLGVF